MRGRCLTLLLAVVAWFVVPAAPRVAEAEGGPAARYAARATTSPAIVERATDRSDRRARPQSDDAAVPGTAHELPIAAALFARVRLAHREAPLLPRTRSSAQPRGPPVA